MSEYQLVLDAWEDQPISDMQTLKDNGVAAVLLRLNDINGGHHVDMNFWPQWEAAGNVGLLRAPYFIYNPWVNGKANYDWLVAHAPSCALVGGDVEVTKPDYSRSVYAAEVKDFFARVDQRWKRLLYTGEWFLPILSSWPGGSYWWGAYPFSLYPGSAQVWTYQQLRAIMDTLTVPFNASMIPGTLALWQCSGDRLILPGSGGHPIDVNLYRGSYASLATLFGESVPAPATLSHVIQRPRADYDLCVTPEGVRLPLLNVVEHAALHGWEAAMNGGAGFDYDDATHATPRTVGFQSFLAADGLLMHYARKAATNGAPNAELSDSTAIGPWCLVGMNVESYFLVTTVGIEGMSGMTQLEAARHVIALGATEAYLMDSGRSAQLEEKGSMIYWPYAPDEKVPQGIGLRRKTTPGGSMTTYKGTIKTGYVVNIKETATGTVKHEAMGGEYVYGERSTAGDNLINFDHYYTAAGVKVGLGVSCKMYVGANLIGPAVTVVQEVEPTTPAPTGVTIVSATIHLSDGTDVEMVPPA